MISRSSKLLILLLLIPFGLIAQSIQFPQGSFRNTNSQDFLAKNLSSKYYNELWTYHMSLNEGVQVIYTFSINDFGSFKSRVTGVKLSVSWKDGNTYVVNKEYSPDTFINVADSTYLRVHPDRPYWAKGNLDDNHVLNFHTEKNGIQYDLNFTFYDIAQGKSLGDGVYHLDNNAIGISLLMPHAKVRGIVAINGDTLQAEGVGYMDHVYQNNLSTEIVDRSFRLKTGDNQNGMFLHFLTLKKAGQKKPIGYGVGYINGLEFMITPSVIDRISTDSQVNTLDSRIMIKPYQTDSLDIRVQKHLNTYSIMNELGGVKKFFAKRIIGGELIEMNGTVLINGNTPGYFYYLVAQD